MSSTKNKLRLAGAFAFLATLALTISCTGFFVNPTVSAITIDPPNPTVSQGLTTQLTAAGTDSNGNAITLTGGTSCSGTTVCWSSATPTVASITAGGLLTGVSAGTSTITAVLWHRQRHCDCNRYLGQCHQHRCRAGDLL